MIYFIQQGDHGPIKIGFAEINVTRRVAQVQTGNPETLTCLAVKEGTKEEEQKLHAQFDNFRLCGEWFISSPELTSLISAAEPYTSYAQREQKPSRQPLVGWRKREREARRLHDKYIGKAEDALDKGDDSAQDSWYAEADNVYEQFQENLSPQERLEFNAWIEVNWENLEFKGEFLPVVKFN
jgi:hypothetical protein